MSPRAIQDIPEHPQGAGWAPSAPPAGPATTNKSIPLGIVLPQDFTAPDNSGVKPWSRGTLQMPLFYINTKRSLLHKQGLKGKRGVQNHTRPVWGSQRPEGAPRDLSPAGCPPTSPTTGSARSHPQLCLGCSRPGAPPVGTGGTQGTEHTFRGWERNTFGGNERGLERLLGG